MPSPRGAGPPGPIRRSPYPYPSPRPPTLIQRVLRLARRVFIIVAAFYCVLAVLGLVTALLNGQMIGLTWPLVVLLIFIVGYGVFAWFAEPLYVARERRRAEAAREQDEGPGRR